MRSLKLLLAVVMGLPLVIAVGLVIFILTLDPNRLKPIAIDAAAKQGVRLEMNGDLSWQFFPNVGLKVKDVGLYNAATNDKLATIASASFLVAMKPLLKREIDIGGINLQGAEVNYWLDKKGQSQWPMLNSDAVTEAQKTSETPTEVSGDGSVPAFNISDLSLEDMALSYRDATGQEFVLSGLTIKAANVNLEGELFDVGLHAVINVAPNPETTVVLEGKTAVNMAAKTFKLENAKLSFDFAGGGSMRSTLNADASWAEPLSVAADIDANISQLKALMVAFAIPAPVTANSNALKNIALQAQVTFKNDQLNVSKTQLKLDQSTFDITAKVEQMANPRIDVKVNLDRINLDDYLPPASETKDTSPKPATVATPLPFEMLQKLYATLSLKAGQVTVSGVALSNVEVGFKARSGLLTLQPVALNVAEGKVAVSTTLDVRTNNGVLKGDVDVAGLQLAPLLAELKQPDALAGKLNSHVSFQSQGKTDQALIEGLVAQITADSPLIKLTSINVEKQFCDAVNLVSNGLMNGIASLTQPAAETTTDKWVAYTELAPLALKATYGANKIQLESLNADIQKLQASSSGEIDLATGDFKFPIDVRLADFAAGLEGCATVDEKWRQRAVPLRCKGNLSNIGAKTCLPDGPRITELVKDKLKEQVKGKVDEQAKKVEDKAKEKAKELLKDKVSEEEIKGLKEGFKNLLKH
jgi:AsmA protein